MLLILLLFAHSALGIAIQQVLSGAIFGTPQAFVVDETDMNIYVTTLSNTDFFGTSTPNTVYLAQYTMDGTYVNAVSIGTSSQTAFGMNFQGSDILIAGLTGGSYRGNTLPGFLSRYRRTDLVHVITTGFGFSGLAATTTTRVVYDSNKNIVLVVIGDTVAQFTSTGTRTWHRTNYQQNSASANGYIYGIAVHPTNSEAFIFLFGTDGSGQIEFQSINLSNGGFTYAHWEYPYNINTFIPAAMAYNPSLNKFQVAGRTLSTNWRWFIKQLADGGSTVSIESTVTGGCAGCDFRPIHIWIETVSDDIYVYGERTSSGTSCYWLGRFSSARTLLQETTGCTKTVMSSVLNVGYFNPSSNRYYALNNNDGQDIIGFYTGTAPPITTRRTTTTTTTRRTTTTTTSITTTSTSTSTTTTSSTPSPTPPTTTTTTTTTTATTPSPPSTTTTTTTTTTTPSPTPSTATTATTTTADPSTTTASTSTTMIYTTTTSPTTTSSSATTSANTSIPPTLTTSTNTAITRPSTSTSTTAAFTISSTVTMSFLWNSSSATSYFILTNSATGDITSLDSATQVMISTPLGSDYPANTAMQQNVSTSPSLVPFDPSNSVSVVAVNAAVLLGLIIAVLLIVAAVCTGCWYKRRDSKRQEVLLGSSKSQLMRSDAMPVASSMTQMSYSGTGYPSSYLGKSRGDVPRNGQYLNYSNPTYFSNIDASGTVTGRTYYSAHSNNSDMRNAMTTNMTAVSLGARELSVPGFLELTNSDFRIEKKLGQGGMGQIFKVTFMADRQGKGEVVAKIVGHSRQEMTEREFLSFQQEVAILWFFNNKRNFAKLVGFCYEPMSILLKYYHLDSLGSWIKRGMLTKRLARAFLLDVAVGLYELNHAGFAHCDVKPANVLIDKDNFGLFAVWCDFGVSQLVTMDSLLVKEFKNVAIRAASIHYASPEAIQRLRKPLVTQKNLPKEDVYSFGMVIYEVVNGRVPWNIMD